jgi:3',5'-nucleoside bisphosphate phosphatase
MIRAYRAELHVHTVLSPCAAVEMIPPLIIQAALERGIDLIAITDHNSSANVRAVQQAAQGSALTVLPGMEVQTREEVHLLCIFDNLDNLLAWQTVVDRYLPNLDNDSDYFGEQFIVDSTGDYVDSEKRLLLNSIQLSIEECIQRVHQLNGLAIPAHVNRKAFGLFANLGMVPLASPIDALEISRHISPEQARIQYPQTLNYTLLQSGDVHHLDDYLGSIIIGIRAPTIEEIRLAFHNQKGRYLKIIDRNSLPN